MDGAITERSAAYDLIGVLANIDFQDGTVDMYPDGEEYHLLMWLKEHGVWDEVVRTLVGHDVILAHSPHRHEAKFTAYKSTGVV